MLSVDEQCVYHVMQEDRHAHYPRFLVVPFQEKPSLGLGACEHLGLVIAVAAICEESSSEELLIVGANVWDSNRIQSDLVAKQFGDLVAKQFGDVFEGLGCLQSCPYDVCPHAISTPHRVPLPYHEKEKELDKMLSLEIIEKSTSTSPTNWVQHHGDCPGKIYALIIRVN